MGASKAQSTEKILFAVIQSLSPAWLFSTPQAAASQALFYPQIGLPRLTKISSSFALSRDLETVITVLICCNQKLYLSTANNGKTSSLLCNKCSLVDKNHVKCRTQWGINKDIQVNLKMQIIKQHHFSERKKKKSNWACEFYGGGGGGSWW